MAAPATTVVPAELSNFVADEIDKDLKKYGDKHFDEGIITRFPPEPNGYLHLGHAKSILLNFGLAKKYNGRTHLRFDDTNPAKEETEYVDSIMEDVKWLGGDWGEHLHYASDYFDQLYQWALDLIDKGKAYVDHQSLEDMRKNRGNVTTPGVDSPFRNRTPAENRDLFERMRAGEFPDGTCVLRAKVDPDAEGRSAMANPNMNMRDPVMYRILHKDHHRTGNKWRIYPAYDYAHGQSDAIEKITHSVCTLEFEAHRPLYEWFLNNLDIGHYHPRQIEFARLGVSRTVMSKRKLLQLVQEKVVSGWDDPRMPTLCGLRRRGVTPAALKDFCDRIGVSKNNSTTDPQLLDFCILGDLDQRCARRLVVIDPIKVVITNFENEVEWFDCANHPEKKELGTRRVALTKEIYIDRKDFEEVPPKGFFRLQPGGEVRLRFACIIKCEEVVKDAEGKITELKCTWDPATKGGAAVEGKKVKGTIHWVSADPKFNTQIEARLYSEFFTVENPDEPGEGKTYLDVINPDSLKIVTAYGEVSLQELTVGQSVQYEREGFFVVDKDTKPGHLVMNRTVQLKDSFAKQLATPTTADSKGAKFDAKSPATTPKTGGKKGGQPAAAKAPPPPEDARALDIRVGRVTEVARHPDAESLYVEKIDVGEDAPRQIVSGLVKHISEADFTNKLVLVWCNLKPAKLRGVESAGMVMCATSSEGVVELVSPPANAKPGDKVSFPPLEPLVGGPPAEVAKKLVDKLLPDFKTNDEGVVCWQTNSWTLGTGVVKSNFNNALVK